jgi:hypothetical protein
MCWYFRSGWKCGKISEAGILQIFVTSLHVCAVTHCKSWRVTSNTWGNNCNIVSIFWVLPFEFSHAILLLWYRKWFFQNRMYRQAHLCSLLPLLGTLFINSVSSIRIYICTSLPFLFPRNIGPVQILGTRVLGDLAFVLIWLIGFSQGDWNEKRHQAPTTRTTCSDNCASGITRAPFATVHYGGLTTLISLLQPKLKYWGSGA